MNEIGQFQKNEPLKQKREVLSAAGFTVVFFTMNILLDSGLVDRAPYLLDWIVGLGLLIAFCIPFIAEWIILKNKRV